MTIQMYIKVRKRSCRYKFLLKAKELTSGTDLLNRQMVLFSCLICGQPTRPNFYLSQQLTFFETDVSLSRTFNVSTQGSSGYISLWVKALKSFTVDQNVLLSKINQTIRICDLFTQIVDEKWMSNDSTSWKIHLKTTTIILGLSVLLSQWSASCPSV